VKAKSEEREGRAQGEDEMGCAEAADLEAVTGPLFIASP
jgi:hypothetical protein